VLFQHFFDNEEDGPQLNHVIRHKYQAAIAQYLSVAETKDLDFVRNIMTVAFSKAKGSPVQGISSPSGESPLIGTSWDGTCDTGELRGDSGNSSTRPVVAIIAKAPSTALGMGGG
ncbi:hypothetical protein HaLaN_29786, partial [Haematococcus lacustris]